MLAANNEYQQQTEYKRQANLKAKLIDRNKVPNDNLIYIAQMAIFIALAD